jgi:hypothetical protein
MGRREVGGGGEDVDEGKVGDDGGEDEVEKQPQPKKDAAQGVKQQATLEAQIGRSRTKR